MELFDKNGCLTDEGRRPCRQAGWMSWGGWKQPSTLPTVINAWIVTRPC